MSINNQYTGEAAPQTGFSENLALLEKLQGLWMARAIHVAVRLGLPDLLTGRAKSLSELALATNWFLCNFRVKMIGLPI